MTEAQTDSHKHACHGQTKGLRTLILAQDQGYGLNDGSLSRLTRNARSSPRYSTVVASGSLGYKACPDRRCAKGRHLACIVHARYARACEGMRGALPDPHGSDGDGGAATLNRVDWRRSKDPSGTFPHPSISPTTTYAGNLNLGPCGQTPWTLCSLALSIPPPPESSKGM
jgi:hypothetical protein